MKEEAPLAPVFEDAAHPVGDLHGHPVTKDGGAVETLGAGNADDRVVPGRRGLAPICREKKKIKYLAVEKGQVVAEVAVSKELKN